MMKRWAAGLLLCLSLSVCYGAVGVWAVVLKGETVQDEMDPDLFGDELYGEIITSTVKDEVNTVQINFHAIMPKGFTSGVCLEMLEDRSGRVYRILAASGNDYLGRMFVPEGAYTILDCYVEGDNTARYPMTIPSDFVAEQGKSYLLECVMSNLEEVEESGEFSPHSLRDGGLSEGSEEGLPEALSGVSSEEEKETMSVEYETAHELPWRDIRHQGEGTAELFVEGISKQRVELLVEITASGGYKKGEYRYSTDKGETWSDTLVIGIATERINNTASGEFTGLSLRFENEEYLLYDVYGLSTRIEYEQESVSNNGKGIVNFCSDDVIYDDNYSIVLKVVKTGTLGTGVFRYSLNGGFLWSEDVLTPEKGLFLIPDTGILVEFFDNGGEFMVRDVYKTKIKGDMSQHDHTPVIAGMLVVLFMVMAGVYHHYSSQRDGADRYELMRYERVR